MARRTDPRVHHHGHIGLLDDDGQKLPGHQPLVGADGRAERHHGGAAHLFEPLAEHGIGAAVGQHHKALFHQLLGGFQRLDGVGQQIARVGVDLQLQPVRPQRLTGKMGGKHRLGGSLGTGGVGQQLDPELQQGAQDIVMGLARFEPLDGHGDQLGPLASMAAAIRSGRANLPVPVKRREEKV